jgi:hypothetical protein
VIKQITPTKQFLLSTRGGWKKAVFELYCYIHTWLETCACATLIISETFQKL